MSIKNFVRKLMLIPSNIFNAIQFKYRHVQHGKDLYIQGILHIVANSREGIVIGNNVRINSNRSSNPIGGDTKTTLFAKGNGKILIGNNCGISNSTIFACESVTIEENVTIGGSVKIYDTDFHWLNYDRRIAESGGVTKPVKICKGAFIGAHSIILKGVTIGEKSIIGAGSVVAKSVPSGEIWAGNPARFIKKVEQ